MFPPQLSQRCAFELSKRQVLHVTFLGFFLKIWNKYKFMTYVCHIIIIIIIIILFWLGSRIYFETLVGTFKKMNET